MPRGAVDLSNGYILLRAQDATATVLDGEPAIAIRAFLVSELEHGDLPIGWHPRYIHWACLRLPNLQIARCAWKETARMSAAERVRQSRNVKVRCYTLLAHSGNI